MFYLTLTLLILLCSSSNTLTKTTKATFTTSSSSNTSTNTTKATFITSSSSNTSTKATKATFTTSPSSEKLFCASCSYEYTFTQLRNQSTWQSPWSRCQNQTASTSTFGATACHTLIRIDYARQYATFYYNASYLSLKKLPDDNRRIIIETIMSSNGSRAQLKAFYECSFEDNCHLPLDRFLQLRTALTLANYNHTNLIQRLDQFYSKPKVEIYTYFHADTLTSTFNAYCGDMNQFDKQSMKTVKPKCLKKKDQLKSKSISDDEVTATVYTCNGPQNTYCNNEKKLKKFLNGVTLTDYVHNFLNIDE